MKKILFALLILTGCGGGGGTEEQQPVVTPGPSNPAEGTVLETSCNGTTLIETIADGNGGSTQQETPNSEQCGYVEPPAEGTLLDEFCEDTTKVTITADGQGGEVRSEEEKSEDCGYEGPPERGTPIGKPYCALTTQEERFLELLNTIDNVLRDDLIQDYADGKGGSYSERVKPVAQECWEQLQMEEPTECPTTYTDTGDSRFEYTTCDGIKQKSSVSYPYDVNNDGIAIIDILVALDVALGEDEEFVLYQLQQANVYFAQSNVDIRLRLAGIWEVQTQDTDLRGEYYDFFYGRSPYNEIDEKQRAANADLAFLFKKRPENPIACGVAQLDATRGLDYTRGITQCFYGDTFQEGETTRYYERASETFVHEVGHLLGLEHEWNDAVNVPIFEYGFGYNLPGYNPNENNPEYQGIYGGYGTIMSYADLSTGRFSDRSERVEIPETGKSISLGTNGGCFCLEPVEEHPPPTDNHEHLQRVRYIMSQLSEYEHSIGYNVLFEKPVDQENICLF